ncbi:unnamed protein product [Protopolystoma xenopodis]|uniref:Uncharacterized protein n=1 Tax=Protopolystoma xenopodis TaxID=117903 RepID=A0A3S5A3N4_9PLAT|nr:unnamed protein product [Protopolystoma xenopodis]
MREVIQEKRQRRHELARQQQQQSRASEHTNTVNHRGLTAIPMTGIGGVGQGGGVDSISPSKPSNGRPRLEHHNGDLSRSDLAVCSSASSPSFSAFSVSSTNAPQTNCSVASLHLCSNSNSAAHPKASDSTTLNESAPLFPDSKPIVSQVSIVNGTSASSMHI